jgi:acetyl esterase/lipase
MNIEENMDPELRAVFTRMPQSNAEELTIDTVKAMRKRPAMMALAHKEQTQNERVISQNKRIPSIDGNHEVPVRIYTPSQRSSILPGLLNIHGGGFIQGDLETDDLSCLHSAEDVGCIVVSVNYRLAPEHPYPAALYDCYSALEWMASNSQALGIDPSRIAISGGSAGGCLAAALALLARDRKKIKVAFQLLLSPCLDDRHCTTSSHAITDNRTFNRQMSLARWRAYLGSNNPIEVSPYAAPARMDDLSGLPPTYIMVGDLELMRDENIEYAMRMMRAGVPTELHVYPGAFHGFNIFVPTAKISIRANQEIDEALKRALAADV